MLNMNSEKPALLESLGGVQFGTHRETLMLMLEKIKKNKVNGILKSNGIYY